MARYLFLMACTLAVACQQPATSTKPPVDSLAHSNINDLLLDTDFNTAKLLGTYTGPFDGSPISIAINYVSGRNVSGYNLHKGLKRNIRGTLEPMGSRFKLVLDEPGDNRYDGHFELFIDTASFSGQGTWTPKNDSTLKQKTFSLVRRKTDAEPVLGTWSDTAQNRNIFLKEDGAAVLSYYSRPGTPQEQLETVNGNWQQRQDSLWIFWQPNEMFPTRKSAFFIVREHTSPTDTSTYVRGLRGENTQWQVDEF